MEKIFDNPTIDRKYPTGEGFQKIYRFDNNFGASVAQFKTSCGSFGSYSDNEEEMELAVLYWENKENQDGDYSLNHTTEITDDVIGHLKEEEVEEILQKIKKLKY